MRFRAMFAGLVLILTMLTACGSQPVSDADRTKTAPAEVPPFQITFDPDVYTLTQEDDCWYLRPILPGADRESIIAACSANLENLPKEFHERVILEQMAAQEKVNQILSQCGIEIRHLGEISPEAAAAANRQLAIDTRYLVTEVEAIPTLDGFGFFTLQQPVDNQYWYEYQVFASDRQGGCFRLTAHFSHTMPLHYERVWEMILSFRITDHAHDEAALSQTWQRPLGEIRNETAYGSTWQEAYRTIIYNPQNYLIDMGHYRSQESAGGIFFPYFYLGIHDFDSDGIPELIIGDSVSAGVFRYADGKTEKLADLCDTESPWGVNGLSFHDNAVGASLAGSGGVKKVIVFSYLDGEYKLGIYSDMSNLRITINGKPDTRENLDRIYPITDACDNVNHYREYVKREYRDGELWLETENGVPVCVDDDFDFNLFVWK